jgi:hypothetical protein
MPWHVESDNAECEGFAVVKDDDGTIEGCHMTEQDAEDQIAALNAAEAESESAPELDDDAGEPEAVIELELHAPNIHASNIHASNTAGSSTIVPFVNVNVNRSITSNPRAARADKSGREERRGTLELRASDADNLVTVFGHASAFDSPYTITDMYGEYEEVVRPGAFDRTIREQDVRLYVNHDGMALARTSAGNLELREDKVGLAYEAELDPSISIVSDLTKLMRAGVMRESSFAFQPIKQKWSADYTRRELLEVKLFDVSVVSLPANPAASAGVRNAELVRWIAELEPLELAGELRSAGVGAGSVLEAIGRLAGATAEAREGKVLSSKNAKLVREAIDALAALLDAASGSRDAGAMIVHEAIVEIARRRR